MAKVTLFLRVKDDGKYPYYPASTTANGRIDPCVAFVKGRRKTFDAGVYYLRFTGLDGKQKFTKVGKDPAVARTAQFVKQTDLDTGVSGVELTLTGSLAKKSTMLFDSIAKYIAYVKDTKREKTWKGYTTDLRYFADFCLEHNVETVDELAGAKATLLKFPKYVMSKTGRHRKQPNSEGTAFNKFASMMIFLKWAGVETGIKKCEWPERTDRDPEEYSEDELTMMLEAADFEERLVLKSFLISGFRSGEMAHLTYECIEFDACIWKVRNNEKWGWKPKKKASVREVPVHADLTNKIAERMKVRNAKPTDLIFPNGVGKPNKHLLRIVKSVASRAGLVGIRIDDHKFRSTAITRWLRERYTVPEVVQLAGHRKMDTIQRYAAKLNVRSKEHRAKADNAAAKFVNVGD